MERNRVLDGLEPCRLYEDILGVSREVEVVGKALDEGSRRHAIKTRVVILEHQHVCAAERLGL
jgi:hypothetical protein